LTGGASGEAWNTLSSGGLPLPPPPPQPAINNASEAKDTVAKNLFIEVSVVVCQIIEK
jgi:hypothetical protein